MEWFRKVNAITALEAEKKTTELALLKEQVNPHFFFNTLNNLYAMSLTQEAETPETILQLSELMRYVIYQGKKEVVTLKQEIKYLRDYLQLQQIRLHKTTDFRFEVDVEEEDALLPPLLFIILVENAFKHGIEPAEDDCFLHLHLRQTGNRLHFSCHNSVDPYAEKPPSGGLGLVNLQRRLNLLFQDDYTLTTKAGPDSFRASLDFSLVAVE
ncbi:MAG: sensor histidine kinase [Bacteroidota bacterium]